MVKKASAPASDLGRAYASGRRNVASLLARYEQLRYLIVQVRPAAAGDDALLATWCERVEQSLHGLLRAAVDVRSAHLRGEFQAARDDTVRQLAATIPATVYGPLAQIHGLAELLTEHAAEDPELRYLCEQLLDCTERLIAALDVLRGATHYVTKRQSHTGIEILDVERAAQPRVSPPTATNLL